MTTSIDRPAITADRVGQGTAVEQSRAVAQVQAAVFIAQQCPRDVPSALIEMRDSCNQMRLAEKAFFRYSRGSGQITGPSIHLARELARCWGNIDYGLTEMLRDDQHGQSEMQAYAWDLQRNTRNASTFIVPHKRDTKTGVKALTDMRDVYENNANNGARRVREAIFNVLPRWYTDEAQELCAKTLQNGGGEPLPKRITNCIERFAELKISVDQLEEKVGAVTGKWSAIDLAQLTVVYGSIQRGEVKAEEEFTPRRITSAEILTASPAPESAPMNQGPVCERCGVQGHHPDACPTLDKATTS